MVGGLLIVPLVSLLTPKLSAEKMDKVFACYEESVNVKKLTSLQEEEEN